MPRLTLRARHRRLAPPRGLLAAALLLALPACGASAPPPLEEALAPPAPVIETAAPEHGVVRLLDQDGEASWRPFASADLNVPLDEYWDSNHRLEKTGDGLAVQRAGRQTGDVMIWRPAGLHLDRYTHLRLRLSVRGANWCTISWTGETEPEPGGAVRSIELVSDGREHVYEAPLTSPEGAPWHGWMEHLTLVFAGDEVEATLHEAAFVARPHAGPLHISLDNDTREAFQREELLWRVDRVPPGARLVVDTGMLDRAWPSDGPSSDGVVFTIEAGHGDASTELLRHAQREPENGWLRHSVGLARFANEPLTLRFVQEPGESRVRDYAFWGNPMLVPEAGADNAIPVILISNDTMRADHLGCYGYKRDTSPYIDAFAEEAVLFENAFTPEVWTPSAHMTMLSGLYPKHHGVTANINLPDAIPTLPEYLRSAGYVTGSFVGMEWWFTPWRGFAKGFDAHSIPRGYREVFATYARAKNWRDSVSGPPPFLFLHNYDLHSRMDYGLPYDPDDDRFRIFSKEITDPPAFDLIERGELSATLYLAKPNRGELELSAEQIDYLKALYDDCIRKVDFATHEILEYLREAGLYDNALIIMTSDHGEAFGEHGRFLHGDVYEHNIRVPLLIRFPQGRHGGLRVSEMVTLMDLLPTVLEAAGIPLEQPVDGRSLLPLIEGARSGEDEIYATRGAWRAVRTVEDKLIRELNLDSTEYYALDEDPLELNNRWAEELERARALRIRLEQFFAPPEDGWQVALHGQGRPWDCAFRVSANERLETVRLARASAIEASDSVGGSLMVPLEAKLTPEHPEDRLIIRPTAGASRVVLQIESNVAFQHFAGGELHPVGKRFEITLDADDPRFANPPESAPDTDAPYIAIWYQAPGAMATPAQTLSEEDIEALRSLGYLE